MRRAGVVQCLERHAGAHGAIADHRNDLASIALEFCGDGHAERGGDRRRGVRGAERVVFAFTASRETGHAAGLPQFRHPGATAREHLVSVGLVADVPHQAVSRRVEHVVQCDRQLDRTEVRRQVPSRLADRLHDEIAQFARKQGQLIRCQVAKVRRCIDRLE